MKYRFGPYDLDTDGHKLFRSGRVVPLTHQPFKLLALLVDAAGEVVTREAIESELWGHPFVEVDQGINQCVRQIRVALHDDPRQPLFIETLPRRGYRFIAPVTTRGYAKLESEAAPPSGILNGRRALLVTVGVTAVLALFSLLTWGPNPAEEHLSVRPSSDVQMVLARADAFLDRRKLNLINEAVQDLLLLSREHPESADIHARLAVASSLEYWYSGREDAAELARSTLARAEELGGEDTSMWLARGVLAFHGRRYSTAIEAFSKAQELNPDAKVPELDLMLGKTLRRMGRWDDANAAFLRALEAQPTSFEVAYALASTARYMRDHATARRFLRHARELDPGHWITWAILPVDALRESGDTALARVRAQESTERIGHGFLFGTSQALSRVLPDLAVEFADSFSGPAEVLGAFHLGMAEAYTELGLPAQARPHYESAVADFEARIASGSWPASYRGEPIALLAAATAGLGQRERALALVEEAALVLPMSVDALAGSRLRYNLAMVLARLGEYERALDMIEFLLDNPSTLTPAILRVDPIWGPLHDRPRFVQLLKRAEAKAGAG